MHLWTYNPKSPNLSVFKWSFSGYFSSLLATLSHSLFTSLRLTDVAFPCLWYSLRLYLVILWVIWLYSAAFCTHVCKNLWTQPLLCNLLHSGTLRASSNQAHFSTSIGPMTVSHFCSMCCIHNHKASSMSSCMTIWACFKDNADGVDTSLVSSCLHPFLVKWCERVFWVKRRASLGRYLKWLTVSAWETSWLSSYQFLTCS